MTLSTPDYSGYPIAIANVTQHMIEGVELNIHEIISVARCYLSQMITDAVKTTDLAVLCHF